MKIRAVAAAAIALAIGVGLTGCNMISPQRTELKYDASDGISADLGGVSVQNAMLFTTDEASDANLVFTAVNRSTEDATVTAQVGSSTVENPISANMDKNVLKVGYGDAGPELVSGTEFVSGTTVAVTFSSTYTDSEGASQTAEEVVMVPVLGSDQQDGVLEEYATLMPEPAPAENATETPVATPDAGVDEGTVEGDPAQPAE
ncbi:hypothetical protein [Gulosibacter molinativorax]|uniref:DNA modification methylase n=1 Tax=Gulosibacter molinativorax TaxID=256821 RepID=A0ABT7C3Y2_9MICO|nr:hypothetical protein [Gulosibacter molinativorax]MDJ1369952.1 hypothetical protein [Gulosibacter molinativorax]QUY63859.1 Hypotetical protein [Gulosibacter molinativorax]